jgi:hypothetical protein
MTGLLPCIVCSQPTKQLCSRCSLASYCSATCQRVGWVKGHRESCADLKALQISAPKGPITAADKKDPENVVLVLPRKTKILLIQEDRGEGRIKTKQKPKEKIAYLKFNIHKTTATQLIDALKRIAEDERQDPDEEKSSKKKKKKKKKKEKKATTPSSSRSQSPKRKEEEKEFTGPPETLYQSLLDAGDQPAESQEEEEEEEAEASVDPEEIILENLEEYPVSDVDATLDAYATFFMTANYPSLTPKHKPSVHEIDRLTKAFAEAIVKDKDFNVHILSLMHNYRGKRDLQRDAIERFFTGATSSSSSQVGVDDLRDAISLELSRFLEINPGTVSNTMTPSDYEALVKDFREFLMVALDQKREDLLREHPSLVIDALESRDIFPMKAALMLSESEDEPEDEEALTLKYPPDEYIRMPGSADAWELGDAKEFLQNWLDEFFLLADTEITDSEKQERLYEDFLRWLKSQTGYGKQRADELIWYDRDMSRGFLREQFTLALRRIIPPEVEKEELPESPEDEESALLRQYPPDEYIRVPGQPLERAWLVVNAAAFVQKELILEFLKSQDIRVPDQVKRLRGLPTTPAEAKRFRSEDEVTQEGRARKTEYERTELVKKFVRWLRGRTGMEKARSQQLVWYHKLRPEFLREQLEIGLNRVLEGTARMPGPTVW